MKSMKKIFSVFLIIAMVMGMSATAFASNTHSHKITVNGNDGHQYTAHQVFKGGISDGKLTDIEWGDGVNGLNLLDALKAADAEAYGACTSAEDVAAVLAGYENNSAKVDAFAEIVKKHLTTTVAGVSSGTKAPYVINVTGDGYYFVEDTTASLPSGDTKSAYILKVAGDVTVTAKDDVVTSEKKVKDTNDTTGAVTEWQDSADYDIGDYVPFLLKATLPDNYEKYKSYSMTFHDREEVYGEGTGAYAGLQMVMKNADYPFVVKVDGNVLDEKFYEVEMSANGHCTFEVHIPDMKATPAKNSSVITVEYYALLTANANVGALGNKNTLHVTYTNDVYQGGEEGTTEEDTVIVFTYKTVINKVDPNGNALAGAEFTLEKEDKDGNWNAVAVVKNAEGTTFTFKGLDDGDYRLVETAAPAGYNKMDDIYFTVTASHDVESADPRLTSLSGNVTTGTIVFAKDVAAGSLIADVENRQGSTLPSTGGMGTTILYIAGLFLVISAAVLFITKRRVGAEK